MTTQNKIIIALLTLIVIIGAVIWVVSDYQEKERTMKHRYLNCFVQCDQEYRPLEVIEKQLEPNQTQNIISEFNICVSKCREKYGQ